MAVPPSGIWPTRPQRRLDPLDPEPHLRRVAAELLAEGDRHRVHQVGAAGLDHVGELLRLRLERRLRAPPIAGSRSWVDLAERREVDGGGEDVVGRLAHVDVVVGVAPVAGEVGDHLVGVHVRGGARAGLEDVDRELVVVLAGGDRVAGRGDPRRRGRRRARPSSALTRRRGRLQPAQPADDGHRDPLARRPGSCRRPWWSRHPRAAQSRSLPPSKGSWAVQGIGEQRVFRRRRTEP